MPSEGDSFNIEVDLPVPDSDRTIAVMPYRFLLVSDMSGGEQGSIGGSLAERLVEANATNFDDVMRAAAPSVRLMIADPTDAKAGAVELSLEFPTLRAFDPRELLQQIPTAAALYAFRNQIVDRLRGKMTADELKTRANRSAGESPRLAWLTESLRWAPAGAGAAPTSVDNLLDQLDLGEQSPDKPAPPKSQVGSIVSAAAGSASIPPEEASALRRTLAETDRRITQWLNAVLHAPPVQALEAAWRSLAFVVAHLEFRKGLRLSLLHASRSELSDRFSTLVIDPIFDDGAEAPDVILADFDFGNTAADMETLDEFAQHAASLPAVVMAGAGPTFFGVKQAWQVGTLPPLISTFDQWQYAKWKTLRDQAHARSLGVVFGRSLMRTPYAREDAADLEYVYREECMSSKDLLWGGPVIAAGVAIGRSLADTGWPTAIAGAVHGRVEGFATATGGPKGDKTFGPTDAQLPQAKIEDLAAVGVNALATLRDGEQVIFWNGLTAARPARLEPQAFLEISLPYQLFAARLSVLLLSIRPGLEGRSAEQVAGVVRTNVCAWLELPEESADEHVLVQMRPVEGPAGVRQLAVTVTPPERILPGAIPIVMGYQIN